MTSEPPRPPRRTRPDARFRGQALGRPARPTGAGATGERESLRESLDRLPGLDRSAGVEGAPASSIVAGPAARSRARRVPTPREVVGLEPAPTTDEIWLHSAPTPVVADDPPTAPRTPPPTLDDAERGPAELDHDEVELDVDDVDLDLDLDAVDARRGRLRRDEVDDTWADDSWNDLAFIDDGPAAGRVGWARAATAPEPEAPRARPVRGRAPAPPNPIPRWRRVGFAVVLVSLVAAIPVLARAGYELVTESTDGRAGNSGAGPGDPGYEELVTSTPTALVVETDETGRLLGVTFLALGSESGGGTVVFVPLETIVRPAGFGINSVRSAYEVGAREADDAADAVSVVTAGILNVGIDEVIQLDDRGWSELAAPVGPIPIDNLDTLDLGGFPLPAGPLELPADSVGPYLSAGVEGESELSQLARREQLWRGWLAAVAAADADGRGGDTPATGLGRYARTLAAGAVTFTTLPLTVVPAAAGAPETYDPDVAAIKDLVAGAVPAPDPAAVGSRRTVRLLNGVAAGPIPLELIRQVTALDGSVVVVGNGPSFDRAETTITYRDPALASYAEGLATELGATGAVTRASDAPDDLDVTVVFGADLLDPDALPAPTLTPDGTDPSTDLTTTTLPNGGT